MRLIFSKLSWLMMLSGVALAQEPIPSMTFSPATTPLHGYSTLTFRIFNPSPVWPIYGVRWSLKFAGGVISSRINSGDTSPVDMSCTTYSAGLINDGLTEVGFDRMTLGPGGSCTLTMQVTSHSVGVFPQTTSDVFWDYGAKPGLSATVSVLVPPALATSFSPDEQILGGITALRFTISNPNPAGALAGINFADTLPEGMTVASPNGLSGGCGGGTINAVPATGSITLSGATLAGGASCTFSVNVLVGAGPDWRRNTVTVNSNVGSGKFADAAFIPLGPILLSKAFYNLDYTAELAHIGVGGKALLFYSLGNQSQRTTLTGISFSATLPAGLRVDPPQSGNACYGSWRLIDEGRKLEVTSAFLPPSTFCGIPVKVTGVAPGLQTAVTSPVMSDQRPPSSATTASIHVGDPFQVNYFPNLSLGDGVINATNPGTLGADLPAGTYASTTGAICMNIYAFSPDEQMVSCCSCPVTPNGLVSLSAQRDLASNPLMPPTPHALVVKLLATVPIDGTCNGSAATVSLVNLASSLNAWGTKVHPAGVESKVTETAFLPATLSVGELDRLQRLCTFINANGRGFGRCGSCKVNGLGGEFTR